MEHCSLLSCTKHEIKLYLLCYSVAELVEYWFYIGGTKHGTLVAQWFGDGLTPFDLLLVQMLPPDVPASLTRHHLFKSFQYQGLHASLVMAGFYETPIKEKRNMKNPYYEPFPMKSQAA